MRSSKSEAATQGKEYMKIWVLSVEHKLGYYFEYRKILEDYVF